MTDTFHVDMTVEAPGDYTDEEIAAFIENVIEDSPGDLSNPDVEVSR